MAAVGITRRVRWDVYAASGFVRRVSWDVYALAGITRRALWDAEASTPSAVVYDDGRCGPFLYVHVDHLVLGTTRVTWEMRPTFSARTPYEFQLQVGSTGVAEADDWKDVGPAVTNTYLASDGERRAVGRQLVWHYRVRLTDADGGVYYSQAASLLGNLGARESGVAKEIIRKWRLRAGQWAGVRGFLLKRKREGELCTRCLDPDTGEVTDSNCPVCKGARHVAGYFRAVAETYSDLGLPEIHEERTDGPEGWTLPTAVNAVFLGNPLLSTGDLWVNAESDERYYVEKIAVKARVRNVPVVSEAILRLLPFGDVAYQVPLEGR